ncbi:hypothetical protein [Pararhizobium sp.]|uniref:hypothetical protein n=1 Tax=Pararhizobium sp. TaxID=1977563 RepID=UPI00271D1E7D|nr:hypothetical protein [Pararhizobium sp.]MDO9417526.1 hypothetical protein [Pararhizobium sp.]
MSTLKAAEAAKKPTTDLVNQYRPLGLKAVLAAALQIKAKPSPVLRPKTAV